MLRRARWGGWWLSAVVLLAAACGGDDGTSVDPDLQALAGDWNATELVLTSVANPEVAPDLIQLGADFSLNVQPSGQYTAILIYAGNSATAIGTIRLSGDVLTMAQTFPDTLTTSGTYELTGDVLILDANTEFDFNLDGEDEPALGHFRFVREG